MDETERQDTRKAMAFDLFNLIDENVKGDKTTFTPEEIKKLILVYVTSADHE